MLQFLKSEAELAAILGHEISHVDQRHCIEKYQYELAARKVGLDGIGQIADGRGCPLSSAIRRMKRSGRVQGARMSIQAGYDPSVAPVLFSRMQDGLRGPSAGPCVHAGRRVADNVGARVDQLFPLAPLVARPYGAPR